MAPSARTDDPTVTRDTDALFIELLCADEELMRAEFDAIIAAEWPSPPPPPDPDRGADAERGSSQARQRRGPSDLALSGQPRRPGIGGWGRQRSPPPTMSVRLTVVVPANDGRDHDHQ